MSLNPQSMARLSMASASPLAPGARGAGCVVERAGIIGTHGNSFFELLRGTVLVANESLGVGEQHARSDVFWNNIDLVFERIHEFFA